MKIRITCPTTARLTEIEFDENPVDATIIGVRGCSRFHPRHVISCDMECIHRLNRKLDAQVPRVARDGDGLLDPLPIA